MQPTFMNIVPSLDDADDNNGGYDNENCCGSRDDQIEVHEHGQQVIVFVSLSSGSNSTYKTK